MRLKVALVTVDSGVELPFDLTRQARKYIEKLGQVAATCVLSEEEELQLLETDKVCFMSHLSLPQPHSMISCILHLIKCFMRADIYFKCTVFICTNILIVSNWFSVGGVG